MEEIALLISQETGKPVAEAFSMEIATSLDLMQYFARQASRLLSPHDQCRAIQFDGRSSYEIYKPLGVVGIISPGTFPGPRRSMK